MNYPKYTSINKLEGRMSKKLLGIGAGFLLSFVAVALWIVLSVWVGWIAGIAGALMGISFIWAYSKLNPTDNGKLPFILGFFVIVIDIVIAELLSLAIICNMYGVSLAFALEMDGIIGDMLLNVLIGLTLSLVVYISYYYDRRKKRANKALQDNRIYTENGMLYQDPFYKPAVPPAENVSSETKSEPAVFDLDDSAASDFGDYAPPQNSDGQEDEWPKF